MSDNSENQKVEKWLTTQNNTKTRQEYLKEKSKEIVTLQQQPEFKEKLALYSALGNEIRLTIFKLLEQSPMCTCVLASILQLKESSISYHLKILEQADLIVGLKSGSFINYHIRKDILKEKD